MKRTLKIISAVALLMLLLIPLSAAASQVAVSQATFPVIINGRVVENDYREYPFILYNGITYFPMTYEDCSYLGLENNWTQEAGNVITKTQASGYYRDFINPAGDFFPANAIATIVNTPINVMGEAINNATQEYPILNYNNVLYFPLTWDWGQKFGWAVTFHENKQLEIATGDFADIGYYYLYNIENASPVVEKIPVSEYADKVIDYKIRQTHSYSPEYITQWKENNGFTALINMEVNTMLKIISVNNSERLAEFLGKGWVKFSDFEAAFEEFKKSHTLGDSLSLLSRIGTGMTSEQKDIYNFLYKLQSETENNYISVCASDNRFATVKKEEAASYHAVGWMTPTDYILNLSLNAEKAGNLYEALEVVECFFESYERRIVKGLPDFYYAEIDAELLRNRIKALSTKLAAKASQKVVFGHSFTYSMYGWRALCITFRNTTTLMPKDVQVTFDIVDINGETIGSYHSNLFTNGPTDECYAPLEIQISHSEYPTAVGIKNIKFTKMEFYPPGTELGYEG